jgi:hypothetical protein
MWPKDSGAGQNFFSNCRAQAWRREWLSPPGDRHRIAYAFAAGQIVALAMQGRFAACINRAPAPGRSWQNEKINRKLGPKVGHPPQLEFARCR